MSVSKAMTFVIDKIPVLGNKIHIVTCKQATDKVIEWSLKNSSYYVCLANAHMIMEAYDSIIFKEILNQSDLTIPDGISIAWCLQILRKAYQNRVCGRDLTWNICAEAQRKKIAVGFYGSEQKTLVALVKNLKKAFPRLDVVYSYSPPFRSLSPQEDKSVLQDLKNSGVQILFVGLGCPKQEYWMAKHKQKFSGVMIGVGAVFDFFSGNKPIPPRWIQDFGLEWLFRLCLEPRRLWYRNLWHSPRFILFLTLSVLDSRFKKLLQITTAYK